MTMLGRSRSDAASTGSTVSHRSCVLVRVGSTTDTICTVTRYSPATVSRGIETCSGNVPDASGNSVSTGVGMRTHDGFNPSTIAVIPSMISVVLATSSSIVIARPGVTVT